MAQFPNGVYLILGADYLLGNRDADYIAILRINADHEIF
jgi:hypothetical protein